MPTQKLVEVVNVANVDDEDCVGNSLYGLICQGFVALNLLMAGFCSY